MKLHPAVIKDWFIQTVWQTPNAELPAWQRPLIAAVRILHLVVRDFLQGQLTLRAMGLVYTTLLSLVPLIAVSFSVLKGFGVHNQIEPALHNMLAPLGEKGTEITNRIIEFVDNTKAGVLGSVGFAFLFYTVVSLIQKIEASFNSIWQVAQTRALVQRFSNYLSIILTGPVLIFAALGITASLTNIGFVQQALELQYIGDLLRIAGGLIPYLLVIIAFTLIYMLVPNTHVQLRSAFIGAVVAGALWETAGWSFATFVVSSTKYTAIYSAFASLILFMIWMYLSWLILLIGSTISFYHQHPEQRTLHPRERIMSGRMRERAAVLIMACITQHFYTGRPPWKLEDLARHLTIGEPATQKLLEALLQKGLLVQTDDSPPGYLPARAPETVLLREVIETIRESGEESGARPDTLPTLPRLDMVWNTVDQTLYQALEILTLKDLIEPQEQAGERPRAVG